MLMNEQQVQTLMEALPYLSNFKDKTIVVKYGGNAMLNDELKNKVLQDILFLQYAGMRPVVVHGGGPESAVSWSRPVKRANLSAVCV